MRAWAGTASSSSFVSNSNPDDCDRIAELLERRLVENLTLRLSEAIGSAFAAEAAKWSACLQASLNCMERESIGELNMRLPPAALGATGGSRDVPPIGSLGSSSSNCTLSLRERHEDHPFACLSSYGSEDSSSMSKSPPTWRKSSNRRRKARSNSQPTVEDIASLEKRLANDIFATKLGKCLDEASDRCAEPGPPISKVVSFSSSIGPSSGGADAREARSASLEAVDSESPKKFETKARVSPHTSTSLQSMSSLQEKQWNLATMKCQHDEFAGVDELQSTQIRTFVKCLPRLLGVLPWNPSYKYSSMIYQGFLLLVSMLATFTITMELNKLDEDDAKGKLDTYLCTVLASGGLVGLCACLFRNRQIVFATDLLESYAARACASKTWDKCSLKDTCCVLVVFALCAGFECSNIWSGRGMEFHCAAVFVQLILFALCSQILRLSRCLCLSIDAYCSYMNENKNFEDAVKEWYLLHAICRSVCASIQFCFVVLQSVAIGTLLFVFLCQDIRLMPETLLLPHVIPGVLCATMIAHLSICASSFTDKCERVPMLINSFNLGDLDANRMYLVEYIAKSKAGFYLFNVQLSSGIVLKTFYVACASAFSLTSKAFVAKP